MRWIPGLLLLISLVAAVSPALSQTPAVPAKSFVMGFDGDPESYLYRWATLVYVEAFKRMGMSVTFAGFTLTRRSALIEEGAIDGEGSRIQAYADAHPELVRVEEALIDFTFSLFSANSKLRAQRPEDLPANAAVEYRRGILMCENTLKKVIPAGRLSTIASTDQGIKKLQAGRTDAYCDIDLYVTEALHSTELRRGAKLSKLFDIASVPTYPYLAKRHVDLAPRLAATLKQMKAEGLLDSYHKQVERQMGWSR